MNTNLSFWKFWKGKRTFLKAKKILENKTYNDWNKIFINLEKYSLDELKFVFSSDLYSIEEMMHLEDYQDPTEIINFAWKYVNVHLGYYNSYEEMALSIFRSISWIVSDPMILIKSAWTFCKIKMGNWL